VKDEGIKRQMVGLRLIDRGIARHGYPLFAADGSRIGEVTSGTQSPISKEAIAMAYVTTPYAPIGSTIFVEIRGQKLKAEVVKTPFYQRKKT
jgi:aminomethyltransferase